MVPLAGIEPLINRLILLYLFLLLISICITIGDTMCSTFSATSRTSFMRRKLSKVGDDQVINLGRPTQGKCHGSEPTYGDNLYPRPYCVDQCDCAS